MTFDEAVEIARRAAKDFPESDCAEPFAPHPWVVAAILEASEWNLVHHHDKAKVGVLGEVHAERQRQDAKWGPQNHPDFSEQAAANPPEARPVCLGGLYEWQAKAVCEDHFSRGVGSWATSLWKRSQKRSRRRAKAPCALSLSRLLL